MPSKPIEQPERKFALVHGRIVLPDAVVNGKCVVVEGDRILGIESEGALGSDLERIDVGGRWITPGFIDLHAHGAAGHIFDEPTREAFETITVENARHGVTSLLATIAPAPIEDMVKCFAFASAWMDQVHDGARVLGVHVEGPYVNPAQKGALDARNLRTPDDESADRLLEHSRVIRIMALAPELPGALALVKRLSRLGIVPSAGHSSARDEQVRAAMDVGLRHVTHIWSAQSSTIREGPWRKPGLLEASLVFDGLTVEMICDNRHLPPTLMKLAYKCIGADRLVAISDATSGAGLPEGSRFKIAGVEFEVRDGVGMLFDRTAFAGSTTLLNQMIPILTVKVGVPLPEAVRMMSLTPARVIGMQDRKGSLEASKDADIAIFDDDLSSWRTMIAGRWVHAK